MSRQEELENMLTFSLGIVQFVHMLIQTANGNRGGVARSTLYNRETAGSLVRVLPGVFAREDLSMTDENLMQIICMKQPEATLNLISALAYHDITTQIPDYLSVSVPKGTRMPKVLVSPVKAWPSKPEYLRKGRVRHSGVIGKYYVTAPERTLVDCFRYRNKIGLDVFLEALHLGVQKQAFNYAEIEKLARYFHVDRLITPYISTVLS